MRKIFLRRILINTSNSRAYLLSAEEILGIDVGGSGIKEAIVDTQKGKLMTDRHRIPTPEPATPAAMIKTIEAVINHFDWQRPVGCPSLN